MEDFYCRFQIYEVSEKRIDSYALSGPHSESNSIPPNAVSPVERLGCWRPIAPGSSERLKQHAHGDWRVQTGSRAQVAVVYRYRGTESFE